MRWLLNVGLASYVPAVESCTDVGSEGCGCFLPVPLILLWLATSCLCVKVKRSFTQILIHRQDGWNPGTTSTLLSSFCVSELSCVTAAAGTCRRWTADPVAGKKWVSSLIHLGLFPHSVGQRKLDIYYVNHSQQVNSCRRLWLAGVTYARAGEDAWVWEMI